MHILRGSKNSAWQRTVNPLPPLSPDRWRERQDVAWIPYDDDHPGDDAAFAEAIALGRTASVLGRTTSSGWSKSP